MRLLMARSERDLSLPANTHKPTCQKFLELTYAYIDLRSTA